MRLMVQGKMGGARYLPKMHIAKDLKQDNHLVGSILSLMHNKQFKELEEHEDYRCYDCLIIKPQYAGHCQKCKRCIPYRHKHSQFFGVCIGKSNAHYYFWFLAMNLILLHLTISIMTSSFSGKSENYPGLEGLVYIWMHSKLRFFFVLIPLIYLYLLLLDKFLTLLVAVSRRTTIKQMNNAWDYKHMFKIASNN